MIERKRTPKEFFSDKLAKVIGSWTFVICQTISCILWMILNTLPMIVHWDPFPFSILANLLQIQGALAASLLLIVSNRQQELDSKNINTSTMRTNHMSKEMDTVTASLQRIILDKSKEKGKLYGRF